MSAFLHDVARASLPVAVVLLILAAIARAVLWAQVDDPRAQRVARQYLEPLSVWCLVALATHLLALLAAGEAGALEVALALGLAAPALLLLRPVGETTRPPAAPPQERPEAAAAPARPASAAAAPAAAAAATAPVAAAAATAPAAAPSPAPAGPLWGQAAYEDPAPQTGLWSH